MSGEEGRLARHPLLAAALGVALFLALWEVLALSGVMPPALVPPPSAVPGAFLSELASGTWPLVVLESLRHYFIGVAIGSILGVGAGVGVGQSASIEAAQAGIARLLRPIPPLAWIPFALIWFGVSEAAAAFIIAISVFWLTYFATLSAVKQVDPGLIELARAFGHGGSKSRPVADPGHGTWGDGIGRPQRLGQCGAGSQRIETPGRLDRLHHGLLDGLHHMAAHVRNAVTADEAGGRAHKKKSDDPDRHPENQIRIFLRKQLVGDDLEQIREYRLAATVRQ